MRIIRCDKCEKDFGDNTFTRHYRICGTICSVNGCDRNAMGNGLCRPHHQRDLKYGDPEAGGRVRNKSHGGSCSIEGCDRPYFSSGYCSMHHQRAERNGDTTMARDYTDLSDLTEQELKEYKDNKESEFRAIRRARLAGAFIESIDRFEVFDAYHGECYLCWGELDRDNWHLEHIVPLCRGGNHERVNVAPAHPVCNLRKGKKTYLEYIVDNLPIGVT